MKTNLLQVIARDLKALKKEMPNYPKHQVAQSTLINIESSHLSNLCIKKKYKGFTNEDDMIKAAAIRTIAQCLRFIENLD